MGLCGSQTGCGCAIVSSGSTPESAIGGFLPTIAVSGAGSGGDPFTIDLNNDWTEELASQLSDAQADIIQNAADILTNAGLISTNTGDIATNLAAIQALESANDGDVTFQTGSAWGDTAGQWSGFITTTAKIFARVTVTVPTGKQGIMLVHAAADIRGTTNTATAVGVLQVRRNGTTIRNQGLRGGVTDQMRQTMSTHVVDIQSAGSYNWDAYVYKTPNDNQPWNTPQNQHSYIRVACIYQ